VTVRANGPLTSFTDSKKYLKGLLTFFTVEWIQRHEKPPAIAVFKKLSPLTKPFLCTTNVEFLEILLSKSCQDLAPSPYPSPPPSRERGG